MKVKIATHDSATGEKKLNDSRMKSIVRGNRFRKFVDINGI